MDDTTAEVQNDMLAEMRQYIPNENRDGAQTTVEEELQNLDGDRQRAPPGSSSVSSASAHRRLIFSISSVF
jgi:hypothetical protein